MPKYRLHSKHFIDGRVYEPGEEVDFSGVPTPDMEGLDDEAKTEAAAAYAEYFSDPEKPGFMKHDFHTVTNDDGGEEEEEVWGDGKSSRRKK